MTQQDEIIVRCRAITKTYGKGSTEVVALRGVDLDVYRGEFLLVVGPSGCGKTTLISIISAILNQDTGCCSVLGNDLAALDQRGRERFRRDSIGFVFQLFNLLPALTTRENVAVPLLIQGRPRTGAFERAQFVLESVGLGTRGDALPAQLSGGQQQRVAIARALVHSPELLVCDEPTGSLDHETGREMIAVMRRAVQGENTTLIIVTHDTRILSFADRVATMDDGRIETIGGCEIAEGAP